MYEITACSSPPMHIQHIHRLYQYILITFLSIKFKFVVPLNAKLWATIHFIFHNHCTLPSTYYHL